jgi:hypothetical protein
VKQKVDPWPGSDSTQTRPPCTSTMRFTSVRPMPVPKDCGSSLSKSVEDAIVVPRIDADAVVAHEEERPALPVVAPASDRDAGLPLAAHEVARIVDEVLRDLEQAGTITAGSFGALAPHRNAFNTVRHSRAVPLSVTSRSFSYFSWSPWASGVTIRTKTKSLDGSTRQMLWNAPRNP